MAQRWFLGAAHKTHFLLVFVHGEEVFPKIGRRSVENNEIVDVLRVSLGEFPTNSKQRRERGQSLEVRRGRETVN